MLKTRVIPCLLMQDGRLVKTRKFKKPSYVGDPINTLKIFNVKEVDEIALLDIGVSKKEQGPNFDLIQSVASECFMPLCYGGGIRSIDDASRIFESGVEKISLQTGAMNDLRLVERITGKYGSSSVVVSVDVKRGWIGGAKLFSAARETVLFRGWQDFIKDAVNAGAGEILLNAVDRDGEMNGLDTDLVREAAGLVSVPVIAAGGTSSLQDMRSAVDAGASAIGVGAFFVYRGPHRAVLITYPKYADLERLFAG